MTPEQSKSVATVLQQACKSEAEKFRSACVDCSGKGFTVNPITCIAGMSQKRYMKEGFPPCPTCTPRYSLLMAMAEKLCWHEWEQLIIWNGVRFVWRYRCLTCGIVRTSSMVQDTHSPKFSISPLPNCISLVEVMELLGMYPACLHHIWHNQKVKWHYTYAEILQSPELFAQEIENFLLQGRSE